MSIFKSSSIKCKIRKVLLITRVFVNIEIPKYLIIPTFYFFFKTFGFLIFGIYSPNKLQLNGVLTSC